MTKSLEEIAKDTCEFEVGCTVCGGYEETRYTDQSTNTTPDRATDNQPTVNERLDEVLDILLPMPKNQGSYYSKVELARHHAKAKLQRLIVEARIDELKHLSVHESHGLVGVYSSKDNQYIERRERIAQLNKELEDAKN